MFAVHPPKYANRAWSHSKRALFFSCSSHYSLLVQEQFQETGEYEKDEERAACDGGSTCSCHPLCRPMPAQSSSHKLTHQTEEKDAPVASGITDASLAYNVIAENKILTSKFSFFDSVVATRKKFSQYAFDFTRFIQNFMRYLDFSIFVIPHNQPRDFDVFFICDGIDYFIRDFCAHTFPRVISDKICVLNERFPRHRELRTSSTAVFEPVQFFGLQQKRIKIFC